MAEKKIAAPKNERNIPEKKKAKSLKSAKSAASSKKHSDKSEAPARKAPQDDVIFALDIGTRTVVGVLAKKRPRGAGSSTWRLSRMKSVPCPTVR